jgi:hypothetical protein
MVFAVEISGAGVNWKRCLRLEQLQCRFSCYGVYGDKTFKDEKLYLYQGFNPANTNMTNKLSWPTPKAAINQRDADLFLWRRV